MLTDTRTAIAVAKYPAASSAARLANRTGRGPRTRFHMKMTAMVATIAMPEYENPKVSLIIPLYAHAELTRACLHSIREHTAHVRYEVILVDDDADFRAILGEVLKAEGCTVREAPNGQQALDMVRRRLM